MIAPRTAFGLAHLKLVWEPGEEWCPVERWMVYEMHPAHRAPFGIYWELLGPNPRHFGRWEGVRKRFITTRGFNITMRQWLLFRETGFFGRPIWCVQGRYGGHKRWWSDVEANLSRMFTNHQVEEPARPGDLEYAEPDLRMVQKLKALDLIGRFEDVLRHLGDDGEVKQAIRDSLDFRERAVANEMARQVWDWMDEQVEEAFEAQLTHKIANDIWDNASTKDFVMPDYDAEEDASLEEITRNFT